MEGGLNTILVSCAQGKHVTIQDLILLVVILPLPPLLPFTVTLFFTVIFILCFTSHPATCFLFFLSLLPSPSTPLPFFLPSPALIQLNTAFKFTSVTFLPISSVDLLNPLQNINHDCETNGPHPWNATAGSDQSLNKKASAIVDIVLYLLSWSPNGCMSCINVSLLLGSAH